MKGGDQRLGVGSVSHYLPIALALAPSPAYAAGGEATVTVGPLAQLFILFGSLFILAAALGVWRFPDFYTRLHAATKLVTLGGIGIFAGAMLAFGSGAITIRILLVAAFFFLTAPLSAYMIARSGYLRGLPPFKETTSVDEWDALGAVNEEQT